MTNPMTSQTRESWDPRDIGGKDIQKDFIARCHVEVSAGGFLRFPLPGDKKGRTWLDERLMAKFVFQSLSSSRQETLKEVRGKIEKAKSYLPYGDSNDTWMEEVEDGNYLKKDDILSLLKEIV